ncbi:MAG: cytochrome c family protein [bacterium]|nr:cytochrome c family protein [bacterium]
MTAYWPVPVLIAGSIAWCTFAAESASDSASSDAVPAAAIVAGPVDFDGDNPHERDEFFTTSEQCAVCHTPAPGATAMTGIGGEDISPYGLWQGTMMANSFRDPYFRAQIRKESAASGEAVQELCLRCHTPMEHHDARRTGKKRPRLADVEDSIFADDSVSCTICHMIDKRGLGDPSTWSGQPNFVKRRIINGPFENPATAPMQNLVNYTPVHGEHISSSALCATCHTLHTEHQGTVFPEQTPYLEWRNSVFSDEDGKTEASRSCQECHMADLGEARIARNPAGFDFNIPVRKGYRSHAIVGGNAFMLDMIGENAEELAAIAEPEIFSQMAAAARKQLAERTARLTISEIVREDGVAKFSIDVENLTGHKFPTGYPSRRAWLHVQLLSGRRLLFESGAVDEDTGRILEVADALRIPHVQTVKRPEDVVVYEMIAADPEGEPTTYLTKMVERKKDNRLLPRGWNAAGPHVKDTRPKGIGEDPDFAGGGDKVHFELPLPERVRGRLRVIARMYYQPVPPTWADALRDLDAEECQRFVRLYDEMDKTPDNVAFAVRVEAR